MKNKTYAIILILLIVTGTFSCTRENFLDIQPRGVVIPTKLNDFRLLLDQVNNENGTGAELSDGFNEKHGINLFYSDNQFINDALSTAFRIGRSQRNAFLFRENIYTPEQSDPDWNVYYNQIYTANVILDGITKVEDGSQEEIDGLVAEAKLHRAYAYFNLVNLYGLHYNPNSANTDLGVPIRDNVLLENLDLTRASVQEIYDLVLSDLIDSIDDLEDSQPLTLTFRPSKAAAYAFLAKVYLYQADYQNALEAANQSLELKDFIRDINDDPTSLNPNTPELIVSPSIIEDEQITWFKDNFEFIFATDEFFSLYDPNDLRSNWFVTIRDRFGENIDGVTLSTGFDANFNLASGISTPDTYLIRAECHARLGNIPAANADLNFLREKRFRAGNYNPLNITNPQALLEFVKDERRREMVYSSERTFDIKRYNLFDDDNITLTHTLDGETATLLPNSKNWAIPIAQRYIQLNPEIIQNPRD